jgi:precorrin-6B methylase 2
MSFDMTASHNHFLSDYSNNILSGGIMEATRVMLLKRQCEPLWLSLLGIQDNQSPTTSSCLSFADICGGTGAISRWLLTAKASLSAIVIDNDTNLLEYGRTLAAFEGINDRIQFLLSDARTISMDDGSVDCAFIHGALHLLEDGEDAIVEMVRIARKRVTVFCAWHPVILLRSSCQIRQFPMKTFQ